MLVEVWGGLFSIQSNVLLSNYLVKNKTKTNT